MTAASSASPTPVPSRRLRLVWTGIALSVVCALVLGLVLGLVPKEGAKNSPTIPKPTKISSTSAGAATPVAVSSVEEQSKASLPTTAVITPRPNDNDKQAGGREVAPRCTASTYEQLTAAIAHPSCAVITLAAAHFKLTQEIVVTRSVLITGSAAGLPFIDAYNAIRAFRVTDGAFLELRYVRILQGRGIIRPRNFVRRDLQEGQGPLATSDLYGPDQMIEIRGGSVFFEAGSFGGTFVGVVFMDDETSAESVEDAILQTLTLTGIRIYGGHVYIAGGAVRFFLCLFWDFEVFTPLSDRIYVGGDVLVLAGEVDFTGCVWQYSTIIGAENGAGFNVAVFAGVTTFTGCYFQENNAVVTFNGVGQAFFVGGGVQVMTGCSAVFFSAVELFTGTGDWSVMGGVQILTGVSINDYYGVLAAFGAGFDFFVGGGYTSHTGVTLNQFTGPMHNALAGGYSFVGGGEFVGIGSPYTSYTSIGSEYGVGGVYWLGGGLLIHIGCPIVDVSGIFFSGILGEYIGVASGLYIALFSPYIEFSGIEGFYGLGGTVFVGGGAAIMGYSPLIEEIGIINEHRDFFILGQCSPAHDHHGEEDHDHDHEEEEDHDHEEDEDHDHEEDEDHDHDHEEDEDHDHEEDEDHDHEEDEDHDHDHEEEEDHDHEEDEDHDHDHEEEEREWASGFPFLIPGPEGVSCTEEERRRALQQRTSNGQQVGLIAANMEKIRVSFGDEEGKKLLAGNMPESLREAIVAMQAIKDPSSPTTTRESADFYIESAVKGYCGACGTTNLTGPAGSTCEYQASCKDLQTPIGPASVLSGEQGTEYPETYILISDLDVVKSAVNASLTNDLLAAAVRTAIGEPVPDPADVKGQMKLQVKVYSNGPDPLVSEGPNVSEKTQQERYKAAIVVTQEDKYKSLLKLLQQEGEVADGPLGAAIVVALKGKISEAYLSYERLVFVPSYNSDLMTKNHKAAVTDLGRYSVVLTDPEAPLHPVTHVKFGTVYRVHLQNFESNRTVKVLAMSSADEMISYLITTLNTDLKGAATATVQFSAAQTPPGEYYLKAIDSRTNAAGSSPVITFSIEGRRRRLFGPLMYL